MQRVAHAVPAFTFKVADRDTDSSTHIEAIVAAMRSGGLQNDLLSIDAAAAASMPDPFNFTRRQYDGPMNDGFPAVASQLMRCATLRDCRYTLAVDT